jgi:hypothetical protein
LPFSFTFKTTKFLTSTYLQNTPAKKPAQKRRPGQKSSPQKSKGTVTHGQVKLRVKSTKRAEQECADQAENCQEFFNFCTTAGYTTILKDYCSLTCGHCAPEGADCRDNLPK